MGETKNDVEILLELAKRLGFGLGNPEYYTYEGYLRDRISLTGITLEELENNNYVMKAKNIMPARTTEDILKVKTPTGKIEFMSTVIGECEKNGMKHSRYIMITVKCCQWMNTRSY